jgi:hypothetical protein
VATSAVQIANLALGRVGEKNRISSLTDNTATARAVKGAWDLTLESCLAAHRWRFARKHEDLALLSYTRSGFAYAYALPTGCIEAIRIFNGERRGAAPWAPAFRFFSDSGQAFWMNYTLFPETPFEIESGDAADARILLTDMEDAELIFTKKVTEPGLFPPLFTDAFAWKLALELALVLPDRPQVANSIAAQALAAWRAAVSRDLSEGQEDRPPASKYVRARRG